MDIAGQENREPQYHADHTGCHVWHEYLLRKRNIPHLGSICLFGCRCSAIYVNVRFSLRYLFERAFDRHTLAQLLHVPWMKEAMLVICYVIQRRK